MSSNHSTSAARGDTGDGLGASVGLWYALSGGVLLWMIHLVGSWLFVPYVCDTGSVWIFHAGTAATFVPTAVGLWLGVRYGREGATSGITLLGWLAVLVNGANLLLIVAEWTPVFFLDACAKLTAL